MDNYVFDEDTDSTEKVLEDSLESSEEGFMRGYSDEEEADECAECGSAVSEEKKIEKEVDGEKLTFCSVSCADEFEENS
ncbi:MAG TPA: hypothetical protein VJA18_01690 [Candidatus Nanoarchaeia archaeon]|nr:hypothetical protein [Candidatus Nanoarchaeia archaeon]